MVDREQRRARLTAYVQGRLFAETSKSRGEATKIAKATGFADAHVANVKNGKAGVGDDFARAIASYWKMSLPEMEAAALEQSPAAAPPRRRAATTTKDLVMASPEFASAHEDVRKTFETIENKTDERSVVEWSLILNDLIDLHSRGLPIGSMGGLGRRVRSTR